MAQKQTPFYSNEIKELVKTAERNAHIHFKTAIIMNYVLSLVLVIIGIVILFTGVKSDALGLFLYAAIDMGLTIWLHKTKSITPAIFSLAFPFAIFVIIGIIFLGTVFASAVSVGFLFDFLVGCPVKIYTVIVVKRNNKAERTKRVNKESEMQDTQFCSDRQPTKKENIVQKEKTVQKENAAHKEKDIEKYIRENNTVSQINNSLTERVVWTKIARDKLMVPLDDNQHIITMKHKNKDIVPIFTSEDFNDEKLSLKARFMEDYLKELIELKKDIVINPFGPDVYRFHISYREIGKLISILDNWTGVRINPLDYECPDNEITMLETSGTYSGTIIRYDTERQEYYKQSYTISNIDDGDWRWEKRIPLTKEEKDNEVNEILKHSGKLEIMEMEKLFKKNLAEMDTMEIEKNETETEKEQTAKSFDLQGESMDIILYSSNNIYEDEEIKIHISQSKVYLTEYTYEHAPGGS